MSEKLHIMLVEDEENFGSVLSQFLSLHNFEVTWLKNGAAAWSRLNSDDHFDCCVLDIMMPEMDGLTLGKEIRSKRPDLPFIYLTAKSMKEDMIEGYKTGADDYLTKPFDSEVLVYKLQALMQRGSLETPKSQFKIGSYEFDAELRVLEHSSGSRRLSPKENDLLKALCQNLNRVVSREEIIVPIWKEDTYFTRRSMDVYMAKIRKYLSEDPSLEITSLHGGGYQLKVD